MPGDKVQVKFKSVTNYAVEISSIQPLQKPLQRKTQKLFKDLKYWFDLNLSSDISYMNYTIHFVENKDARQHHTTFHLFSLQLHIQTSFELQTYKDSPLLLNNRRAVYLC